MSESTAITWRSPPTHPNLSSDSVHIWRVWLSQPLAKRSQYEAILSEDEQARASRFYFERDRNRFIVAHANLRFILGRYLDTAPARLRFAYGEQGKPYLENETGLHFNLSHAGDLMLLAVSCQPIGIDVEQPRDKLEPLDIAASMFAPAEYQALASLPKSQQNEAFFRIWTRKEAFIKALGEGLSYPLDGFVVSLTPEPASPLYLEGDLPATKSWWLRSFSPALGYVAALATHGRNWRLKCWNITTGVPKM